MPIWKPPCEVPESPAKWEVNPDRCTFVLQALLDAMTDGKFKNTPTASAFNDISRLFWLRYNIYHTAKQFKNYYQNRKAFWGNICWARERTGIGWDDSQKMILASEEWWRSNEGRKGLLALKDKPIQDYDLLDTLFAGQRAVADHCYGPFVPIPLISDEGSGDSDNPDDIRFIDPQTQPSQGDLSMNSSSGTKRRRDRGTDTPVKKTTVKKKEDTLSPHSAKVVKKINVYLDLKESRRRKVLGSTGTRPRSGMGSEIPSGSINSMALITTCMKVMSTDLKLDEESDLFYHAVEMLVETPDWQSVFLAFTSPSSQLKWLQRKVTSRFPEIHGGTAHSGYDLNQPPIDGDL